MKVAKVFPPTKYESGKLVGFCDIMFNLTDDGNGCLTMKGFKIFKDDKNGGVSVAMPSTKNVKDGEWYPTVKLDVENQDAKDLLDNIQSAVNVAWGNLTNQASKHKANNNNNNGDNGYDIGYSGGGIDDSDLPF